jgi:hypothetical protein
MLRGKLSTNRPLSKTPPSHNPTQCWALTLTNTKKEHSEEEEEEEEEEGEEEGEEEEEIPRQLCHMSGAEVVEWVGQLQEVWTPAPSHRLLLQLVVAPDGSFTDAERLQLYDLMLLQLARPGWKQQGTEEKGVVGQAEVKEGQQQQQAARCLPPVAADLVLGKLTGQMLSRCLWCGAICVGQWTLSGLHPSPWLGLTPHWRRLGRRYVRASSQHKAR